VKKKKENNKNNGSSLYKKPILTTKEAGKLLKVGVQTIKNYIYKGKLKSFKTPGGHHRILRSDLPTQIKDIFMEELKNGTEAFIKKDNIELTPNLHETYLIIIKALAKALEIKDASKERHSDFAVNCALKMAQRLNLTEQERENLEFATLLKDIGKIEVSERILEKPGNLSEEEYSIVKRYPRIGEKIVGEINFLEDTKPLIRHHQEMFNGKGYPDGLAGEDIPLGARILAIAGTYQALISDRPYRRAFSKEEAVRIIKENSGTQFDPKLVDLFLSIV